MPFFHSILTQIRVETEQFLELVLSTSRNQTKKLEDEVREGYNNFVDPTKPMGHPEFASLLSKFFKEKWTSPNEWDSYYWEFIQMAKTDSPNLEDLLRWMHSKELLCWRSSPLTYTPPSIQFSAVVFAMFDELWPGVDMYINELISLIKTRYPSHRCIEVLQDQSTVFKKHLQRKKDPDTLISHFRVLMVEVASGKADAVWIKKKNTSQTH
jgi:hypothetical protein